ncbi:MAG: flavin reductase family protein [Candidatus Hodarchaeales archaeon]
MKKTQEFVINIPTSDQLSIVETCGTKSGRDINKWKELSLTPIKAEKITTPLISECPINIECKVIKTIDDIGTHTIFIGEVLCVHKPEGCQSAFEITPMAYSAGKYGRILSLSSEL